MRSLMIINLDNLKHNIKVIKEYTNKDIIAVVKSNAYGLGAIPIVKTLIKVGITYFACNTLNEAKVIQRIARPIKIIILDSLSQNELQTIKDFRKLIISVNALADVDNIIAVKASCPVHLQIDTGMNRIGIKTLKEAEEIIKMLSVNSIMIEGIYTHFASNEDDLPSYEKQKQKFTSFLSLYPFSVIHMANTPSLTKDYFGNFIRIGMALYGYHSLIKGLKPAVKVVTRCINIIKLTKDDEVGYDGTYKAKQDEVIGVIPHGYYEGEITPYVYYRNVYFFVIAKRCMNHSFILINDKINYLSYLSLLPKDDKIRMGINYYRIFTSMKQIPKIYLKQVDDDLPTIIKTTSKSLKFISRRV